jgi:3-methyladenine DNA glycosylase/8-oxoguanine DNA glycosylase
MTPAIRITTPVDFDFWRTVYSHGWSDLPPFRVDPAARSLSGVFVLSSGRILPCTCTGLRRSLRCTLPPGEILSTDERHDLLRQIRTVYRLDEDFSSFHQVARRYPAYRWISRARAGRLLRAPTMFEDAVKMICTTNCTWALTTIMVKALIGRFGAARGNAVAFPEPAALAGATEAQLRKECSTGYRSRSLLELARKVASGALPIEAWRTSSQTTADLFAEMCTVRGIGPYAAGNLLKLVGRYEYLGLDSWVRAKWCSLHTRGRKVNDRAIERFYAPYGNWRGLFVWLEMTRDWHDEKFAKPFP